MDPLAIQVARRFLGIVEMWKPDAEGDEKAYRDIQERLSHLSRSFPRGSGPYGTYLPGEGPTREQKIEREALSQAQAYSVSARDSKDYRGFDPTNVRNLRDAWVAYADKVAKGTVPKKTPKPWPRLRWNEIT
jgi:hypothetical protein